MAKKIKIAFGGGCHWCTEAVFQSLKGVFNVEQGYLDIKNNSFSEGVIVHFNEDEISLRTLIEVHLHTHKSTSNHSMRTKYKSAIYTFSEGQKRAANQILDSLQPLFKNQIITEVVIFKNFKSSREEILNYYYNNPQKPFCEKFINPKIAVLEEKFSNFYKPLNYELNKQS